MRFRTSLAVLLALMCSCAAAAVAPQPTMVTNTSLDPDAWTQPQAVALSADAGRAYTANYYGGKVSVVDTATGALLAPIAVANDALTSIVVNHAGTRAYVGTRGGKVWTIDLTATPAAVLGSPIDVRQGRLNVELNRMVIAPDDSTLYLTEVNAGRRIAKIALASGAVTESGDIVSAGDLTGLAISPDGTSLYAGRWSGSVMHVSSADLQVSGSVAIPHANVVSVIINAQGTRIYVSSEGECADFPDGCLATLDTGPFQFVSSRQLNDYASSIALSPDGEVLYAARSGGSVVAVPLTGPASIEPLAAGPRPFARAIAVRPDGGAIYVTSYRDAPDGCTNPVDDVSLAILTTCHAGALTTITFAAPGAPTGLRATPGEGSAEVAFTPGAANGTAITNTEYSVDNGPWTAASPATATGPVVMAGLTAGQTYAVRLRMRSSSVAGPASSAVQVTARAASTPLPTPLPATVPSASAPLPLAAPTQRARPVPPLRPAAAGVTPGSSSYVTTGVVPDGATAVVQVASQGATTAGQQSMARGTARARVRTACPITASGGQRTYRCTTRLGGGNWILTTRAMNGSVVVAQSVRRVHVVARVRRAVTG